MRGIRKLSELDAALSILTTYAARPQDRPYDDGIGPDGYQRYKWRGTDGEAYDNVALREAMIHNKPLMWFLGMSPGVYMPVYPVWLVGEEPADHQFVVALEDGLREQWIDQVFHPADLAPPAPVRGGDRQAPTASACVPHPCLERLRRLVCPLPAPTP